LINVNGTLYFTAYDSRNGREVWSSDGNRNGTRLEENLAMTGSSNPRNLKFVSSKLIFTASTMESGEELWLSDIAGPMLRGISGGRAQGTHVTYEEGSMGQPIAPVGLVSNSVVDSFSSGQLTVRLTANARADDRLVIQETAVIATNSFGEVLHAGSPIGTYVGGEGSIPLTITFNMTATSSKIQDLVQAIHFRNVSSNPSTASRSFSMQLSDGSGATSLTSTNQIAIRAVNDAPTLSDIGPPVTYQLNGPSIQLSLSIVIADPDSSNFDGGEVTFFYAEGRDASNRLDFGHGLYRFDSNNNLLRDGVVIGSRNANGGFGLNNLTISFNSLVTPAMLQELVRSIRFRTINSSFFGSRVIGVHVSDGDGGTSDSVSRTIQIAG
jgi:ELWxxDGT repeat protein